jgi:putative ABC transport system permease protein
MIGHWLTTGWRSLIANPLFSLITIASLSIGCCGALLAGANIKQHLSYEKNWPHADRIVLTRMRDLPSPNSKHPMAQGQTPTREGVFQYSFRVGIKPLIYGKLPDVEAMTRVINGGSPFLEPNGEPTKDILRMVDREFFDVFELPFVEGSKDSAFVQPESLVLTYDRARELFGKGPYVGRTVVGAGNTTFHITGVVEAPPQPTIADYTILALVPETGPEGEGMASFSRSQGGGLYIRMKEGVDRKAFIAQTDRLIKEAYFQGLSTMTGRMSEMAKEAGMPPLTLADFEVRVSSIPITDIHLAPRETTGIPSTGEKSMLWTLGGVALALLAVSAFNYVVLSLARAIRRRREVGLRKVLGASNGAVTRHYLAEAGLVTAISLAVGFGLAEILHPWFARALGQPEILFNLYDPVFLGGVAAAFVVLVLLVGAYPALYLAHIRPRAGIENADDGGGRPRGRITSGLLGLQIAAATVLLTLALTMAAQARYVAARPLGFNMTNLYALQPNCGTRSTTILAPHNLACTASMERLMRETPGLKRVGWSSTPGIFVTRDPQQIFVPGRPQQSDAKGYSMSVDADFLPLAGAKLLAGRLFDKNSAYDRIQIDAYPNYPKEKFDTVPVVVTRAILPALGVDAPQEALGKRFMIGGNLWTKSYEVVGVIEDWHQRSLKFAVSPIVFVPGGAIMYPVAEIDEADVPRIQQQLAPIGGGFTGDFGPFRVTVTPLAQAFQNAYVADRSLMGAVIGFAALAILVAALGVFGLSAFDMRRRVREIGIRKALGASPGKVAGMVLGRQIVFAGAASLLSWPVAWWLANSWLEGYVYRTSLGPAVLPLASLIVAAFVALAVSFNSARASAIRPNLALRSAV